MPTFAKLSYFPRFPRRKFRSSRDSDQRSDVSRLWEIYGTGCLRSEFQVLRETKPSSVKITIVESFSLIDILVRTTVFRNSDDVRTITLVAIMVALARSVSKLSVRSIVRFKAIAIPKNLGAGLPSVSNPSPRTFIA